MNLLSQLIPEVKIVAQQPGCDSKEIDELTHFSPVSLPPDYLALAKEATEAELQIDLNDGNFWFLRIWGPLTCINMNEGYHVQEFIPNSLAIGDDEGCGMLVLLPKASPAGIYHIRMSNIDMDGARFLAGSLTELLRDINELQRVFMPETAD